MKIKAVLISALVAFSAFSEGQPNKRITIHGAWSEWNPIQFITDLELRADRSYAVQNNTGNTISVLQVEITWDSIAQGWGRTPRGYANVGAGQTWTMTAPPYLTSETYSIDFIVRGWSSSNFNGKGGIHIEEGPEIIATD